MQTKKPAISVLTPVWNGMPYVKEAVDSVLSQDFEDWELVISDNGSTDGTREYLDSLKDPRIRVYKQEKNLGIDGNLNFLYTTPKSDIAYCLCADDYFNPGALRAVVEEWSKSTDDVAYIVFNWKDILQLSVKGQYIYDLLPRKVAPSLSQLAFFLFGNFPGNLSNISTRVKDVLDSGGFDENYKMAGDFEIWARIARTRSVVLSDFQATYVRRHENTATNYMNKQGTLFREQTTIYEKLIDQLSGNYDRSHLVDYFNIDLCSYHFRQSIRNLLYNGKPQYLWSYISAESRVFWPKWKRIVVSFPYAFNEKGRMSLLVKMAGKMIVANK
ncbi:glycosyltransferase family 2 protein [Chryseolinea sp. T2]|uniref:glycosyltransferase family 2 protein n=1 Tax=Chryseolinea sp. T2 TaxID=3129255 RepID=UPI0030773C0E